VGVGVGVFCAHTAAPALLHLLGYLTCVVVCVLSVCDTHTHTHVYIYRVKDGRGRCGGGVQQGAIAILWYGLIYMKRRIWYGLI
jgi:hypothetical protein